MTQNGDSQDREHGHPGYLQLLKERIELHIEKSAGYGTPADPFANYTAVAAARGQPRYLYALDRVTEKLVRIRSLHAAGRVDLLEEEFKDCASLFDCATAMLREDSEEATDTRPPIGSSLPR